jgi:uncharacterized protein YndB with AHSA1/START domain
MTTTKDLRHTVHIKAKPSAVYGALMDSKKHTAFTGAPVKISRKVGGAFSAHGPHLKGINVDLSKNKRIVPAWRAAGWPKGHFSGDVDDRFLFRRGQGPLALSPPRFLSL